MKTAIVHDWLVTQAGAEQALEQIINLFPESELYSLVDFLPANNRAFIMNKKINTSFIQKLPLAKTKYRNYLALMPLAIEKFDLSDYDLVISSSHAVAKGVITKSTQLHICYCYTPMRYAWDLSQLYLKETKLDRGLRGKIARLIFHYIRIWDYSASNRVDRFIAISNFVAKRIKKIYGKESTVIYPPIDTNNFNLCSEKENYYLTVSRLVPYKKVDLIVETFSKMPDKKLIVIGDGPDSKKIKHKSGKNVELLGYQSSEILKGYMRKAKAFVFAAEEDFGIAPLEAQACGTPVIAFGKGGVSETIRGIEGTSKHGSGNLPPTGVFFKNQTITDLIEAVEWFEKNQTLFSPAACRENALRFAPDRFRTEFADFVEKAWKSFVASNRG